MNDPNLFDTLFPDSDDIDAQMDPGLMAINAMFGHLNFNEISRIYDLELYNNVFNNENKELLSVMHFNIRCAYANKIHLEALLHTLNTIPDVIALTETWFTTADKDYFLIEGYQAFHVVRANKAHGGVSILVRDDINAELEAEYSFIASL